MKFNAQKCVESCDKNVLPSQVFVNFFLCSDDIGNVCVLENCVTEKIEFWIFLKQKLIIFTFSVTNLVMNHVNDYLEHGKLMLKDHKKVLKPKINSII